MPPKPPSSEAELSPQEQSTYDRLLKIRESKSTSLLPTPMLRTEIVGFDGTAQPFKLRPYQAQAVCHFLCCRRMVLGDGTGLGKCLVGDTLLSSDQGLVRIQDLKPKGVASEGFYSLSNPVKVWTGSRMSEVTRFYWGGTKPTLRVTTRDGYRVEGSLVHPILVRRDSQNLFVKLPDLKVGDCVVIDRTEGIFPISEPKVSPSWRRTTCSRGFTYPAELTPDLAALIGWVIAEGHMSAWAVTVTQHLSVNPDSHLEIRELFKKVFGWSGNYNNQNKDISIVVSSKDIIGYLLACGVDKVTAHYKKVPDLIFRGTRESVRRFLSAIMDAEASVGLGGVEFSSSSEELIRGVQQLLLRFGVVSALSPKKVKGYDHVYWRLTFFGVSARKFSDCIGFGEARKREALELALKAKSNTNKDLVLDSREAILNLKSLVLKACSKTGANSNRVGSGLKQFGESFQSTLKNIITHGRNPSYEWLNLFLEIARGLGLEDTLEYLRIQQLVNTSYYYDPIVSIVPGEAEVMDLEINDPDHCFVGNGIINHNTISALSALCYLWAKDPQIKVMVICPKSALRQWGSEIDKFTTGIKYFIATGTYPQRQKAYLSWKETPQSVLICNYQSLMRDWQAGAAEAAVELERGKASKISEGFVAEIINELVDAGTPLIIIPDEASAFKNPSTKVHQTLLSLSKKSDRVWALTATLLKNRLEEGFGIYQVVKPGLFSSFARFRDEYCITELQKVRVHGREIRIPIIVGYKNLVGFKARIDPYFYGRSKYDVATELPTLTTREVLVDLTPAEVSKYEEALTGVLEMGDGEIKEYEDTKALTSLIYCQEIVDSLSLLDPEDGSDAVGSQDLTKLGGKEQALLDLLEGDLESDRVIIYTRFEKLVTRLTKILTKNKIKSVRVTGKESAKKRSEAQATFQNLESDTRVIFITDAGSEAINLQAASAMIFYDSPWSWGNYVQLLGRPIRIGSPHQNVFAIHLVAERPSKDPKKRETIDHAVLRALRRKKGLIDQIIGEAAQNALTFERGEASIRDLLKDIKNQGK